MVHEHASVTIERPVATVFDFVVAGFFDNYPRWSPQVRSLEALDGEGLYPGARIRQVRVDHGRRSETVLQVTALEPERRARFKSTGKPAFAIEYGFATLDGGRCRLDFTFELLRLELYMRPFERMIRRAIREGSEAAVADIKHLIERER